jgi:hypothetical protein
VSGADRVSPAREETSVKFLMSIYGSDELWESLSASEDWDEVIAATDAHNRQLAGSGELLGAYGVGGPITTKRVRVADDGVRVVSDGPYIETKEFLGSFYVVDCEDLDRALAIAAEMPSARFVDIEVKPLLHGGTADEL